MLKTNFFHFTLNFVLFVEQRKIRKFFGIKAIIKGELRNIGNDFYILN